MSDIIASAALIEHPKTENHHQVPMDPNEIKPKIASDIAFWSKEFNVSPELLHEAGGPLIPATNRCPFIAPLSSAMSGPSEIRSGSIQRDDSSAIRRSIK